MCFMFKIKKQDIMARHNVIYVKAWCSHDNPLGKVVPGTPNLTNEIWGVVSRVYYD